MSVPNSDGSLAKDFQGDEVAPSEEMENLFLQLRGKSNPANKDDNRARDIALMTMQLIEKSQKKEEDGTSLFEEAMDVAF